MKAMKISQALIAATLMIVAAIIPAPAQNVAPVDAPAYVNPTGNKFPIVAWGSFNTRKFINHQQFQTLADCGFTIAKGYMSPELSDTALAAMRGTGLKMMLDMGVTRDPKTAPRAFRRFAGDPDVCGFFLGDEPGADLFERYASLIKESYAVDPKAIALANLLPSYAPTKALKAASFYDYFDKFCEIANPNVVSYDFYPIIEKDGEIILRNNFYKDLEEASEICRKRNVRLWTFYLAAGHLVYPNPTKGMLFLEAFSGLAYGAQGFLAYSYAWYKVSDFEFTCFPIDENGRKTKYWYMVSDLNHQIQALAPVFLGCKVLKVRHTGDRIPAGTKRLSAGDLPRKISRVESNGIGVLVSHLTNHGRNYMLIVNRDFQNKQRINLTMTADVVRLNSEGKRSTKSRTNINLEPGGYAIFTWTE